MRDLKLIIVPFAKYSLSCTKSEHQCLSCCTWASRNLCKTDRSAVMFQFHDKLRHWSHLIGKCTMFLYGNSQNRALKHAHKAISRLYFYQILLSFFFYVLLRQPSSECGQRKRECVRWNRFVFTYNYA